MPEVNGRGIMASMVSTVQYWLRASLPGPPGQASHDEQRGAIYRAALQQFEELLQAAAATGYAARPLPLFYALSQAGRAIVACHGDEQARNHGLTVRDDDIDTNDPLETLVTPSGNGGWFHAVTGAARSSALGGPVSLGALIASLPELSGEIMRFGNWPRALFVESVPGSAPRPFSMDGSRWFPVGVAVRREEADSPEAVELLLADYPVAAESDYRLPGHPGGSRRVDWEATMAGDSVVVLLRDPLPGRRPQEAFEALVPQYRWVGRRWLRPFIAGAVPPAPLMTWWVLLFGLSMLARYHPVEWVRALDRQHSTAATELERAMDMALEALPQLVLEALARTPTLLPPFPEIPPMTLTPP